MMANRLKALPYGKEMQQPPATAQGPPAWKRRALRTEAPTGAPHVQCPMGVGEHTSNLVVFLLVCETWAPPVLGWDGGAAIPSAGFREHHGAPRPLPAPYLPRQRSLLMGHWLWCWFHLLGGNCSPNGKLRAMGSGVGRGGGSSGEGEPHCTVMGKEGTALSGAALCQRAPRGPGGGRGAMASPALCWDGGTAASYSQCWGVRGAAGPRSPSSRSFCQSGRQNPQTSVTNHCTAPHGHPYHSSRTAVPHTWSPLCSHPNPALPRLASPCPSLHPHVPVSISPWPFPHPHPHVHPHVTVSIPMSLCPHPHAPHTPRPAVPPTLTVFFRILAAYGVRVPFSSQLYTTEVAPLRDGGTAMGRRSHTPPPHLTKPPSALSRFTPHQFQLSPLKPF